jgi:hypothetical protein
MQPDGGIQPLVMSYLTMRKCVGAIGVLVAFGVAWFLKGTTLRFPEVTQELTGKPRLTPPWLGSGQREVTTLPRV